MFEVRLGAVKPEYGKSSLRNMVVEKTENQKKTASDFIQTPHNPKKPMGNKRTCSRFL